MTEPAPQPLERGDFPVAGVPYDPGDLSKGIWHPRLSGNECSYLAPSGGACNKCGWLDPAMYDDAPAAVAGRGPAGGETA